MPRWQNKFATNHCTKEQQDLSRNAGPAPIHPPFVLETPPSSCHVQYLIGILTLQITQHLLLGCLSEALCSLQAEFKGLFADTQTHACHCARISRPWMGTQLVQASMTTGATPYPHQILNRWKMTGGWRRGRKFTKPLSFTSFISNLRLQSTHLF